MTKWWWLAALLALLLMRVYYQQVIGPASLNQDEAALLMNAQFIAESGMDEWGESFPSVFRSFGDAKLPGYIYLTAGFGQLFGFESWVVRLPSLLAGIFLPVAVGLFVWQLFHSRSLAWLSGFLLVLSPWTWHYGTIGFEAHFALPLFVLSLALMVGRAAPWWNDVLAGLLLLWAGLTYNTPWILIPAVMVGLLIWYWGEWRRFLRVGGTAATVFLFVLVLTWSATSQKSGVTVFQDPTLLNAYPAYRAQFTGMEQAILGNQWVYFGMHLVQNWLHSWSWDFLVISGGENPWHTIPGFGHLHPVIAVLSAYGMVFLTANLWYQRNRKYWQRWLTVLWFTAAALAPAVITVDAPHATRSLFFFVMLTVVSAFALQVVYDSWCQRWSYHFWGWNGLRASVVLVFVMGFLWWWMPARVRWDVRINPRWHTGLNEVLQDPRTQTAAQQYLLDPHGTLYPYVVLAHDVSAQAFVDGVRRSAPDTAGLQRVEAFGTYRFVFQQKDIESSVGVYLEPMGNQRWDIIEL